MENELFIGTATELVSELLKEYKKSKTFLVEQISWCPENDEFVNSVTITDTNTIKVEFQNKNDTQLPGITVFDYSYINFPDKIARAGQVYQLSLLAVYKDSSAATKVNCPKISGNWGAWETYWETHTPTNDCEIFVAVNLLDGEEPSIPTSTTTSVSNLDYTITFVSEGETYEIVSVKSGNIVRNPAVLPTKTGQYFLCWKDDLGIIILPSYAPVQSQQLTANFASHIYALYNLNPVCKYEVSPQINASGTFGNGVLTSSATAPTYSYSALVFWLYDEIDLTGVSTIHFDLSYTANASDGNVVLDVLYSDCTYASHPTSLNDATYSGTATLALDASKTVKKIIVSAQGYHSTICTLNNIWFE